MKKNKEHIQVQVGAFLAIGILLFMTAIFMLSSKTSLFQTQYELHAFLNDISGLGVGAPVQLGGINVGYIEHVEHETKTVGELYDPIVQKDLCDDVTHVSEVERLNEEERQKRDRKQLVVARITMKINRDFKERIRTKSRLSIRGQGLLGDRLVYLTPTVEGVDLNNGDRVICIEQQSDIMQMVNDIGNKGQKLMDDAKPLIRNTTALVSNVNRILEEVIRGRGLVHEVIYNPSSTQTLSTLNQALQNFESAGHHVSDITRKINNGQGTLGALVNDDSLYAEIKGLFGKANRNKLIKAVIRYTLKTRENEQLK